MSEIILPSSEASVLRPLPSVNVTIRAGVLSDVPFLDSLQRMHTKQVGWMPRAQFEGKIKLGHVLVAEAPHPNPLPGGEGTLQRVGYCIGNDRYFKRDDVGIIYQMNVLPGRQRSLVGASLLKAQFERSAYGCKLYCCWCAQDIAANKFWESMGFVALAYRAGSEKKSRVHIFWQKRIRQGDTGDVTRGGTPWWFPAQTSGGSIREDRIVLPIPLGTHWSDAKPLILPGMEMSTGGEPKKLASPRKPREAKPKAEPVKRSGLSMGGLRFAPLPPVESAELKEKPKREKKENTQRVKQKNDPRLVAAARELRDRWLEQVNSHPMIGRAKYDVARAVAGPGPVGDSSSLPQLEAA